ncbi:hypothetical protein MUG94_07160 [Arthrobacter gengyunqii]|uniref:V-type ATPase subunit n=1 Tax=Arthrobacter gengyunqii TaxID=2886940 RepID=A0A9X1M3L7_9MICC|nr:hypothetical protein [Arthrobacter gengyunqii]MCC3270317.1 hypothetical protein [Arthrobacter gengyunqii]UOY97512.1 hypothetical protein MUG94_07160 [Arthrobacter gengyunqii]
MAQRRAGAGTCRGIAAAGGLQSALDRLAETAYADELEDVSTLAEAQRATRRTVLWQLRVLAGWLPAGGARLVRSAAAVFEADNIVSLELQLRREQTLQGAGTGEQFEPFDLGGLATAWPRLRTAASVEELLSALASSPWGDPGSDAALSDVLTVVWLRRLANEAPSARSWAASTGALISARLVFVDRSSPGERLLSLLRPLIGTGWVRADTPDALRDALPPGPAQALDALQIPTELWRAEALLAARVETDGFRLLRAGLPGPDVVLGAMAVLAVDAWRVRAALAAAAVNAGTSEVLDAVA